jgi:hypothetical protein
VAGGWRRLYNEDLHNLYAPQNDQVKEDEMSGTCRAHGTSLKCIQNFW